MSNIGLNVIEFDGSASPAIQSASTSVAGFVIETPRGPVGDAVLVTSFAQFVERFGAPDAATTGPLLVQGFFGNGGRRAWVCRVGSITTAGGAAKTTLKRGNANLLTLTSGARGAAEVGTWANDAVQVWVAPSAVTTRRDGTTVSATGMSLASVRGFAPKGVALLEAKTGDPEQVTLKTVDAATGEVTWDQPLTQPDRFNGEGVTFTSTDFDLTVKVKRATEWLPVETWTGLTLARDAATYAVRVLNDASRGSKWVTATDARPDAQVAAAHVPATDPDAPDTLTGGIAPDPAASDWSAGLLAFDPRSVQLIGVDTEDRDVVRAALDYCEQRGDCMFIGSVPEASTVETAAEYGVGFRGKKVYGALYGPWIKVIDPVPGTSGQRKVPPTGHVMGVYARTEANRGIHKAPAGDEARLLGAIDVEYVTSDADHTFLVRDGSINGIRAVPGAGIVVDASRTLSTDTRWLYVNVRLLFNFVKSSLRDGLRWVRQEPNKQDLWDAVKFGTVRPFLTGLWRQGAFGTGDPDEVFTIVCDESNNPPDEVDKGNFNLQITFWPSKPAETVVVLVGQQPAGGAASES